MNDNVSLSRLAKELNNGALVVKALLVCLLTDVALFFEVGKNMGGEQVRQTADLILEDYTHFKPEDFVLCFKRAKKGHYGKLFDRLDGQIIMQWLMDYDNERDAEIEAIRAKQNRELKALEVGPLLPATKDDDDIFNRNFEKLKADRERRKTERMVAKAAEIKLPNPVNVMYQRWMDQFTKLSMKQQLGRGIRMVMKYGAVMDINEYLEYKQFQYGLANLRRKNAVQKENL